MNTIRQAISEMFGTPMQDLSFPHYFRMVNTAGKVTERTLLELNMVCFTYIEEMEKKQALHEENFNQIQEILGKLVTAKVNVVKNDQEAPSKVKEDVVPTPKQPIMETVVVDEPKKPETKKKK